MRYPLFIIGFLLLFAQPESVMGAACPQGEIAQELLTKSGENYKYVVGHYTQEVLKRADKNTPTSGRTDAPHKFEEILAAFLILTDTRFQRAIQQQDLPKMTACMHVDLAVMEAKIEEVRCKMLEAKDNNSPKEIRQLIHVKEFLVERYRNLTQGFLDMTYEDEGWPTWQVFDGNEEKWCCESWSGSDECVKKNVDECIGHVASTRAECSDYGCLEPAEEDPDPLCPFDTDYFPPTLSITKEGDSIIYGCDEEVLANLSGGTYEPIAAERESLEELLTGREIFINESADIISAIESIYPLAERIVPNELENFGENINATHMRRYDCGGMMQSTGEGGATTLPEEEWYKWPDGAGAQELRGPFSAVKDHLHQLRSYLNLMIHWETIREVADYLKDPHEFPEGSDEQREAQNDWLRLGLKPFRDYFFRIPLQIMSIEQGKSNSSNIPKIQDTQLQIIEAMKPIRPTVLKLIETATGERAIEEDRDGDGEVDRPIEDETLTGFRKFVLEYAYLIRRSCIFRPCNERLEQIIKIVFEDDCFPYASGDFLQEGGEDYMQCMEEFEDDEYCTGIYGGKPLWKNCKEAAEK